MQRHKLCSAVLQSSPTICASLTSGAAATTCRDSCSLRRCVQTRINHVKLNLGHCPCTVNGFRFVTWISCAFPCLGSVATFPSFVCAGEPSACLWWCCQAKSRKGHCLDRNVCGALSWRKERTQRLVEGWSLRYMSLRRTTPAKFIC